MQTMIVAGGMPAGLMPGVGAEGDAAAAAGVDFAALLMAQIQGQGGASLALPLAAPDAQEELTLPMDGVARDAKTEISQDLFAQVIVDPLQQGMAVPVADVSLAAGNSVAKDTRTEISRERPVEIVVDPVQQGIVPVVPFSPPGVAQPEAVVDVAGKLSVSPPGIKAVEGKRAVSLPGADAVAVDEGRPVVLSGVPAQPKLNVSSPMQAKTAEFAVDGKILPSDAGVKAADGGLKQLPAETFHLSGAVSGETPAATLKSFSPEASRLPDATTPSAVPVMLPSNQMVADAKGNTTAMVPVPVGNAGWDDALGQKVVWMAGQQQQVAELHLNPPHLGPMEVRLSISNDQVSALFVSHQPAVREAIEAAMPRLREILADSGMMLGNATVSSDSLPRQQQPSGGEGQSGMISRPDTTFLENSPAPLARGVLSLRSDGRGMVDLFA